MSSLRSRLTPGRIGIVVSIIAIALAWGLQDRWLPAVTGGLPSETATGETPGEEGHAHDDHDAPDSLHLSPQARRSMGLAVGTVELETFRRTIEVPGRVAERPGRTRTEVTAPLTGVVTHVNVVQGEAVRSGRPLFDLRLTHEDLVQAQSAFLETLGKLDVEEREIARLQDVADRGVIAGKTLLERQYEKDKLEAVLSAHREALLLHGLSEEQVKRIARERKLLRELHVAVPSLHEDSSLHHEAEDRSRHRQTPERSRPIAHSEAAQETGSSHEPVCSGPVAGRFIVQDLRVHQGQAVQAGETLCALADLSRLYIEGQGFEHDAEELVRAANEGWEVTAVMENRRAGNRAVEGLRIVYVANRVETESRALLFYVDLPNEILRDAETPDGHRFLSWRYKPGQRVQLHVPVERWPERIVLPVDAVASEGAESYVFVENGDHFDRRPVHVEYRGRREVVIARDGSLFPAERVALSGAHQLQMALKQKAGGGGGGHHGHMH